METISSLLTKPTKKRKKLRSFSRLIQEHYEKALLKKRSVPSPENTYLSDEETSVYLGRCHTITLQGGPSRLPPVSESSLLKWKPMKIFKER